MTARLATASTPRRLGNFDFFTRLGKRVINALDDKTGDGYVFRVDMRLRPYGDGGPLVGSFAMLENYYHTQGREWERYAWIKGRPICGSQYQELAAMLRPFVFRKYLDFGAFSSMRELHAQIRREVQRRELDDNIKLGPGGIREIEFIAQVFQLIRGGKAQGCSCARRAPHWMPLPRAICCHRKPWRSCSAPMPCCATWNTVCNIWTMRKPRPCRKTRRTAT